MGQRGLFDETDRHQQLDGMGDPLARLNAVIDWSLFLDTLRRVFAKEQKGAGGRPPFDYVMMFKILVLQRLYNLSDEQAEFQVRDRLSFMRFLGLGVESRVPDQKTIWLFRDTLVKADVIYELFDTFNAMLAEIGLITRAGSIIDASFVEQPKQRNTREENEVIKAGGTPEEWKSNPNKLRQKDVDARWAKKGDETHYGNKNHVKVDSDSKIVVEFSTTPASTHDSKEYKELVDGETDQVVYADSAYVGQTLPDGVEQEVCEKGTRNNPLTDEQKKSNKVKSRVRVRVEHTFAFIEMSMIGSTFRGIGIDRAHFWNGLTNLVYNLRRYETILRLKLLPTQ
jgi:IS5 family transposase